MGGKVYFSADDGIRGQELWKSNGTKGGTVLVKDINPGDARRLSHFPDRRAGDGCSSRHRRHHGQELWKTNGTNAGTVLVKNITPGDYGSSPSSLTDVGGTLFFTADDGVHGEELWKSNGSSTGTVLVKNIRPARLQQLSLLPDRCGRDVVLHR